MFFRFVLIFFTIREIIGLKGGVDMEQFSCRPRIFFGTQALSQLKEREAQRVLIITDQFFAKSPVVSTIGALFFGAEISIFGGVLPDPSLSMVAEVMTVFNQFSPDVVVALGGGSPMDCAKGVVFMAEKRPFFIAIPTTSGTGSEVTSFSILSHGDGKHPLVDETVIPDWAILDTDLVKSLPKSLIADAGFDVLVHDLEALVSTGGNHFTAALAEKSFALTYRHLQASYGGDTTVRGTIHQAATMAGMAFDQSGLGICHSLAHALGGQLHLPHGRLNAMLIPHVMAFNQPAVQTIYAKIATQCGIGGTTPQLTLRNFGGSLARLRSSLGLPATLSQAGVSPPDVMAHLDSMASLALGDPCTKTNPRTPSLEDLKSIIQAII